MSTYKAPMDNLVKSVTAITTGAVLIPTAIIVEIAIRKHLPSMFIGPVALAIGLVTAYCCRPLSYTITATDIIIRRQAGSKTIALGTLRSVSRIDKKQMGNGVRTFGSSGYFGYFGRFYYSKLGAATLYATDRNKMVLLDTSAGNVIVSPDDPEAFIHEATKAMRLIA